jgi:hypothetical protein
MSFDQMENKYYDSWLGMGLVCTVFFVSDLNSKFSLILDTLVT